MVSLDVKTSEMLSKGYTNLGIFVYPSEKVDEIIKDEKYTEVLLSNLSGVENICNIFVK